MSRPPSFSDLVGGHDYINPDLTLAPSPSSSFMTLRRLTKSPASTIRSGFRRSRTNVSSIASSSTTSLPSVSGPSQQASRLSQDDTVQPQAWEKLQRTQSQTPDSCASRQQLGANDCALSRFIAWVAVRRNASRDLSVDDKRRCPLINCRRPCPSPELMLQHLIACDKLDEGWYYCHDCKRNEQFTETRCTRCIGHPSKRKKIAKMAKSFFSSLGQRPKTGATPELDLGADDVPGLYEMEQSESVHEIGTSDTLAPILEDDKECEPLMASRYDQAHSYPSLSQGTPINAGSWDLQEEPRNQYLLNNLAGDSAYPSTMAPIHEAAPASSGRPQLQVQTSGFGFTRLHSAKRRRVDALMHQSSTRSTASTNSTASNTSTVSSMSAASHTISPLSAFSGVWGHGYDTDDTTPADDSINLDDFFPPTEGVSKQALPEDLEDCFQDVIPGRCELPADQPHTLVPNCISPAEDHKFNAAHIPRSAPQSSQPHTQSAQFPNIHAMHSSIPEVNLPELEANSLVLGTPVTLVETVKAALDEHVEQSGEKLRGVCGNHLVDKFVTKMPSEIAYTALGVLSEILSGRHPTNPVDLLCFIHIIYSFSLVIREQDAPSQWSQFFSEALRYSSSLSKEDCQAYVQIVALLWKPDTMTGSVLGELPRTTSIQPGTARGKQIQGYNGKTSGALTFTAQCFLDELDYLAIHDLSNATVMVSELASEHGADIIMEGNWAFQQSVDQLLNSLATQFPQPSFLKYLAGLRTRAGSKSLSTPRRLELDLMRAGRTCLPPGVYFDGYIHLVRGYIDKLYQQHVPYPNSRPSYHLNGVKLIQTLLIPYAPEALVRTSAAGEPTTESIDAMIAEMTPTYDEGCNMLAPTSYDLSSEVGLPSATNVPDCHPSSGDNFGDPAPLSKMIETSGFGFLDLLPGSSRRATTTISPIHTTPSPHDTPTTATSAGAFSPQPVKVVSDMQCKLCDYRPEGDPRWFLGSMNKHMRTKHQPPKIYRCEFPGCKSQYTNRLDNLKQHQAEKNHYVGDEKALMKKSSKRKREKREAEGGQEPWL